MRFADDCLIGFAQEADARQGMGVLPKRFNRFNRTMHPEKTVLIAFKRPSSQEQSARGTGTCDLLGFPHYWGKTRRGYGVRKRKTIRKRLRRFRQERGTWCRANRHEPLKEPYRTRGSKLRGYYQYYGIRGHFTMLAVVCKHTERAWQYWLSRRSHKGRIHWQKFDETWRRKRPLPTPRIIHRISQSQGQQSYAPNGVSPVR